MTGLGMTTRMRKKLLVMSAAASSIFFAAPGDLHAQDSLCGPAPSLPTSLENGESIKGQLQGQADLLSKLVGKAELSGQVEAARKQLYQNSDQFFAAQKDAYLSYLFCLLITQDNSLSTEQKLKALNTFKEPIPSKSGSRNIFIYVQCHAEALTTTPLPPEGTLRVLYLWAIPEENGGGGLAEIYTTKGNEITWPKPKDYPILNGYRCNVINYGVGPIFNYPSPARAGS
jgi:hypothetical protein